MAISPEEAKLRRRLNLSWGDVRKNNPDWDDAFVKDYLEKQEDIDLLTDAEQTLQEQVDFNTQTNSDQQLQIDSNTAGVNNNATNLTGHINDISGAHAGSAISYDNSGSGLTANNVQAAIDEVDGDLDLHTSSNSQHGATGDIVGNGDFCTPSVGGVVNLAALVNDAVDSTVSVDSPDAPAAAATYSQADTQTTVDLVNEMKGDVNQLVADLNSAITQLNDLIAKMKTAKQMNTV